jgi:8-oxo-dGTP pyrophosphatase MutT (NUDIX family)
MASILCETDSGSNAPVFVMRQDELSKQSYVTLSLAAGDSVESRTKAVAGITEHLRSSGVISGWRNELFPISDSFYSPPKFLMERAAVDTIGALDYGVHINGLVRNSKTPEEPPQMWVGRRSATKSKFPGMLDHIAAGGQPAGLGLLENVVKECHEEAGIPAEITRAGIHSTGVISYESYLPKTDRVSRVVLFNYDLYLPEGWTPKPVDGEVQEFFLWTIDQVKESMAGDCADPFKPNCYVVIIDYLMRLGYLSPDTPGYLDVVRELRSGDCV